MFDRSLVDVEDMLYALNLHNVKRIGDEVQYSCPFGEHAFGDVNPSASMNVYTTVFYCFSCQARGDAVSFLAKLEGVSPMLAARWLRERYDPGGSGGSAREVLDRVFERGMRARQMEVVPQLVELPDGGLPGVKQIDWKIVATAIAKRPDEVPPALQYPFARGFSAQTLFDFDWGYDEVTDRVTFTVHNEDGLPVGVKGRAWDNRVPKYIVLGDTPGSSTKRGFAPYHTGLVLFNLFHARGWNGLKQCVVVEGELNAMMVRQVWLERHGLEWGEPPVVGLPGSTVTKHHALLIRRFFDAAVLFFDSDSGSTEGRLRAVDDLAPFMPVKVVPEHEGDPCSLHPDEVVRLIQAAQPAFLLA